MKFSCKVANMVVVLLLFLLYMLGWLPFQYDAESSYRLLRDGERTTATITGKSRFWGGAVTYEYSVNGKTYSGDSRIPYDSNETFETYIENQKAGKQAVVFYSKSKPELSMLHEPEKPIVFFFMMCLFTISLYAFLAFVVIPKMSNILRKWFSDGEETHTNQVDNQRDQ